MNNIEDDDLDLALIITLRHFTKCMYVLIIYVKSRYNLELSYKIIYSVWLSTSRRGFNKSKRPVNWIVFKVTTKNFYSVHDKNTRISKKILPK